MEFPEGKQRQPHTIGFVKKTNQPEAGLNLANQLFCFDCQMGIGDLSFEGTKLVPNNIGVELYIGLIV